MAAIPASSESGPGLSANFGNLPFRVTAQGHLQIDVGHSKALGDALEGGGASDTVQEGLDSPERFCFDPVYFGLNAAGGDAFAGMDGCGPQKLGTR
jgi:hypothetical protein